MKKRILYGIIMMIICACMLSVGVFATEGSDEISSGDYTYFVNANGNTVSITSYTGSDTEIKIPDTIDGYKVTIISNSAFEDNDNIISVEMSDNIININTNAFAGCTNIESVTLSDNITVIGAYAFEECYSLEKINLPKKLTKLGEGAFSACRSLSNVELPDTLKEIPSSAFALCLAITEFNIPDSIERIGADAFAGCTNLEKVFIPDSVIEVRNGIFGEVSYRFKDINRYNDYYCEKLKTVGQIGSNSNIEFGWTDTIPSYVFSGMEYLEKVVIPEGITTIGQCAFSWCPNLKDITIPASVTTTIPRYSDYGPFSGCTSIKTAGTLNSNCDIKFGWTETIPSYAFAGIDNLELLYIPKTITEIGDYAFSDCRNLGNIVIPASVTKIGNNAFYGCTALNTAGPLSDQAIGKEYNIQFEWTDTLAEGAFAGNQYLEEVVFPEGITEIPQNTFRGCTGLKTITIPDTVIEINANAFANCTNLTNISFSVNLISIGDLAFAGCTNLAEIKLPVSLNTIGDSAFAGCTNLAEVELPVSLNTIGDSAFSKCKSLYTIKIPGGVVSIGSEAFEYNTNLESAYFCGDIPKEWGRYVFNECSDNFKIYYPASNTSGWTTPKWKDPDHSSTYPAYPFTVENCEHSYVEVIIAPTCTETGYTKMFCSSCGDTYMVDGSETEKLPHDFSVLYRTLEPTCGEQGYTIYRCSYDCGATEKRDYVDATGEHDFDDSKIYTHKASCVYSGETYQYCNKCGYKETLSIIPALGHDFVETSVVEPTCTEAGFTNVTCSRCNEVTVDHIISAHHTFGNWTITKEATATATGEMQRKCSECNTIEKAEIPYLPSAGHTHTFTSVATSPDCTREGYTTYSCACGYNYRDNYTAAFGHSFGDWVVTRESTVTTNGIMERHCETCGEKEIEYLPLLPEIIEIEVNSGTHQHSYSREVIKPTCEEEGYTIYECACGDTYTDNYKDKLDHDFGDWEVVKEPTATKDGKEVRVCDDCGKKETRKIDSLGNEENEDASFINESTVSSASEWTNPFTDISKYDSSYEAICYVYENDLFKGVSATRFAPKTNMNRAMFVTVIGRLAEMDTAIYLGETRFCDVLENQWYTPYVAWASEYGIVNGYNETTFGISDDITVEQAVVMIMRYAEYTGYDTYAYGGLYNYSDASAVSSWAEDAMIWAINNGIYICESELNPQDKASRELVAEMLYYFSEWIG